MTTATDRQSIALAGNPLGLSGIVFVEYLMSRPQALGAVLETMGFTPIATPLARGAYRQGGMKIIINAHATGQPRSVQPAEAPVTAAIALRVRDAAAAYRHVLECGARAVPTQVAVMELNIPAIHGVGASRIYLVDRAQDFSIYDVDFIRIPTVDPNPPALTGLHRFGVVQYIGSERSNDWTELDAELLGFQALADELPNGILPTGRILKSPCGNFHLQLIEPEHGILDVEGDESLHRIGFGTPDLLATVEALRQRRVSFVESMGVHSGPRGALTQSVLGGVRFELEHDEGAGLPS
jgi:4-hydroxyphenylpyruvate dioxygenase